MTQVTATLTVLTVTAAAAFGGIAGAASGEEAPSRTALVVDAAQARDGRELVDPRLRGLDADVRLPRTEREARTNLRYFAALGHRIVVVGATSQAAAEATDVHTRRGADLSDGVALTQQP